MSENGKTNLKDRIRKAEVKGTLFKTGWGEEVELRSMTVAEKIELYGDEEISNAQAAGLLPRVIIKTAYDPATGQPLFSADDDLEWLEGQPANIVEPLALEGLKVSGVSEDAVEEAKGASS